jgi:hypothetical protein
MVVSFFFPAELIRWNCGSGRGEEPSGGKVLRLIQIRLATPSLRKISLGCQEISHQGQIADSSFTNAVSFSSACTTNRFSPRCASAIQIVRPSQSTAETQPKLQPRCLRLSAMISQYFTRLGKMSERIRSVECKTQRHALTFPVALLGATTNFV